jgi:integral membrane protein
VRNVLLSYRIMAYIVGTLLVFLFIGVILKYLTADGTDPQRLGEWLAMYVGVLHGFLYMVFLVTVAVLAAKARWSIAFTLTTVISGLVPFMTFYAERRATAKVRAQFPETRPHSARSPTSP